MLASREGPGCTARRQQLAPAACVQLASYYPACTPLPPHRPPPTPPCTSPTHLLLFPLPHTPPQGHIAIDTAIWPEGTPGCALDALARVPLWSMGLNYRHGTGHGVGAALNVHEGPQSISSRWGGHGRRVSVWGVGGCVGGWRFVWVGGWVGGRGSKCCWGGCSAWAGAAWDLG